MRLADRPVFLVLMILPYVKVVIFWAVTLCGLIVQQNADYPNR
jgi:hypothetical protein